ncbi:MAG TPA: helix-hairpin-helix domain-containing protein [Terriglobales bacterium]|nr:helix-hairpin-helix domain-containing protein [Terriglobales bacterium]
MPTTIDINSATVGLLTQLPGIAKNMAYKIVNHRQRHGLFTSWDEMKEIKGFPTERLPEIKSRATLICPKGEGPCAPPRHADTSHLEKVEKKPAGYTRKLRNTRSPDKLRQRAGPRH